MAPKLSTCVWPMHSSRVEWLQSMPIFGALRDDALEVLLHESKSVQRQPGEYFFREGDRADSMFVLESGRAAVSKCWRDRDVVLLEFGPGDCFGEMALMDLAPRSASVRALGECRAIELSAADLLRLNDHDHEQFALIQMNLGRELCRRLRATDEQLFLALMGEPSSARMLRA